MFETGEKAGNVFDLPGYRGPIANKMVPEAENLVDFPGFLFHLLYSHYTSYGYLSLDLLRVLTVSLQHSLASPFDFQP